MSVKLSKFVPECDRVLARVLECVRKFSKASKIDFKHSKVEKELSEFRGRQKFVLFCLFY